VSTKYIWYAARHDAQRSNCAWWPNTKTRGGNCYYSGPRLQLKIFSLHLIYAHCIWCVVSNSGDKFGDVTHHGLNATTLSYGSTEVTVLRLLSHCRGNALSHRRTCPSISHKWTLWFIKIDEFCSAASLMAVEAQSNIVADHLSYVKRRQTKNQIGPTVPYHNRKSLNRYRCK